MIVRCQREGVPYECDVEIIRPDGERRWVSARGEAIRDASGVVIQAHGTIQDITERKLADAALAETTARLKEAQQLTGIGHWTRDLRTDTPYWSGETYRIHGRDPSLGPPKHYPEIRSDFTPKSWAIVSAALKRLREEGVPYELDAEIVKPNGERRWASFRGAVQRDASGAIIQTHGTVQDITERKLAAEALAETTARLKEAQRLAGIGHWTRNTKNGKRYWSEEAYRIHGWDPASGPPVDDDALSVCFTPESWAIVRRRWSIWSARAFLRIRRRNHTFGRRTTLDQRTRRGHPRRKRSSSSRRMARSRTLPRASGPTRNWRKRRPGSGRRSASRKSAIGGGA